MIRKAIDFIIEMLKWVILILIAIATLVIIATGNREIALLNIALIIVYWLIRQLQNKKGE